MQICGRASPCLYTAHSRVQDFPPCAPQTTPLQGQRRSPHSGLLLPLLPLCQQRATVVTAADSSRGGHRGRCRDAPPPAPPPPHALSGPQKSVVWGRGGKGRRGKGRGEEGGSPGVGVRGFHGRRKHNPVGVSAGWCSRSCRMHGYGLKPFLLNKCIHSGKCLAEKYLKNLVSQYIFYCPFNRAIQCLLDLSLCSL
ncbi:uncharacterized protein KNAG_0C00390 [Huiozyma naganishii CBS 8797]|uniref:Uncharacterized protein n=1 Tax=Huiozyma naganishii (strain ATCC MYA-139 / BCRC 22969 / CBS 8797 / KCTC 17520 / NBRC 10181 / NCYC 3082 / Yp74L-3) TaxID=1071383 RepID=J7RHY0_HUIN7|nr:hypothetical protein KNAG_0C00390 [Kazachstania naganishii CBS 8797]CCK69153.1 hypothetical protein KNAG_0C00390 [Kazachstania naganishii CBS 8797]